MLALASLILPLASLASLILRLAMLASMALANGLLSKRASVPILRPVSPFPSSLSVLCLFLEKGYSIRSIDQEGFDLFDCAEDRYSFA